MFVKNQKNKTPFIKFDVAKNESRTNALIKRANELKRSVLSCDNQKMIDLFFSAEDEILYGGQPGGGKSYGIRLLLIYYALLIPRFSCALLMLNYSDIDSVHMQGENSFYDIIGDDILNEKLVTYNDQKKLWKFANRSTIKFTQCSVSEKAKGALRGTQYHLICFDEATLIDYSVITFANRSLRQDVVFSDRVARIALQRKGEELHFPKMLLASNPTGISHSDIKRAYLDTCGAKGGTAKIKKESRGKEMVTNRRFIPSSFRDNPYIDQEDYVAKILGMGDEDSPIVRAMLDGDWNVQIGAVFAHIWDVKYHVIRSVEYVDPETEVHLICSMDWGTRAPFSIGWSILCDGSEILINGDIKKPNAGSVIRIFEFYGCEPNKPNTGLNLSIARVAVRIKEIEEKLMSQYNIGWIHKTIDSACANNVGTAHTVHSEFVENGLDFDLCKKPKGQRIADIDIMKEMLRGSVSCYNNEYTPACSFFVHEACEDFIHQIPGLIYNSSTRKTLSFEYDIANQEDHVWDEYMYSMRKAAEVAKTAFSYI